MRFAFQPDCFAPPCDKPKRKLDDRLDLGPQIAVWIEAADRSRFVDTVLVTNLTARYGLGNRPGLADLPSGPKHPYGKRLMVLPIWAYSRGQLYPQVVMQDGKEEWMGFHEPISSPDPYYCRPMGLSEVDVDAIACPTKVFNSAKGKLATDRVQIPYPPRNDLNTFHQQDCDDAPRGAGCARSAEKFSMLNDLDAVSAPTPGFDKVFEGRWQIPPSVKPSDDLALMVEVSREFDQNDSHRYTAYNDRMLSDNGFSQTGLPNNLGQPSVVYRVPFKLDGSGRFALTATGAGYGRVDGTSGTIAPIDATISDKPGSGVGRLRTMASPWPDVGTGEGRVFVRLDECGETGEPGMPNECEPAPAAPAPVEMVKVTGEATSASATFKHTSDAGKPVQRYEIRLLNGKDPATDKNFLEGVPKVMVDPGEPGAEFTFTMSELKPLTPYVIAIRAIGRCNTQSPLAQMEFTTSDLEFQQLSGCFIATAAYGSPLAPGVEALRGLRNQARQGSALAAAAIDLYERASPPLAALLGAADAPRAVVRRLLAPVIEAAQAGSAAARSVNPLGPSPAR